jgi:F-type H+-transporting ATPase subunit b
MDKLGIDIRLIVAQFVNFVIFYLIYKKFVAKPLLNFIKEEKKKTELLAQLDEEINIKRNELLEERKRLRESLIKENEELRKSLMKDAIEEKDKIIKEAKYEAKLIKERAMKEIKEHQTKMEIELKKKMADIIVLAIEAVVKDFLDEKQEKEITARVFKNLKKLVN